MSELHEILHAPDCKGIAEGKGCTEYAWHVESNDNMSWKVCDTCKWESVAIPKADMEKYLEEISTAVIKRTELCPA